MRTETVRNMISRYFCCVFFTTGRTIFFSGMRRTALWRLQGREFKISRKHKFFREQRRTGTANCGIWITCFNWRKTCFLQRKTGGARGGPLAETAFPFAETAFPLAETAFPFAGREGREGAAALVRPAGPRTRTRSQNFVRVISVLNQFLVPGSLEVKTLIKQRVGGTKKTKNRNGEKGSHSNANPRKIHEKNEKSE